MKWFLRLSNPDALNTLPEQGFHFWDVKNRRVLSSDECVGAGTICEELFSLVIDYAWRMPEPLLVVDETDGYVIVVDHAFTVKHLEGFYGVNQSLTSIPHVSYSKSNLVKWLDEGNLDHIKLRGLREHVMGLALLANFPSSNPPVPINQSSMGLFYTDQPEAKLYHFTKMFFEHETDTVIAKVMWNDQSDTLLGGAGPGHYILQGNVSFATTAIAGGIITTNHLKSYLSHQLELFTDQVHNPMEDSYETPYLAYIL